MIFFKKIFVKHDENVPITTIYDIIKRFEDGPARQPGSGKKPKIMT